MGRPANRRRRYRIDPPEPLEARQMLADGPSALVVPLGPPARRRTAATPLVVPGRPDQVVTTTFTLVGRSSRFRNEMGLFPVDDASGRIGGLRPGDRGYAAAALARSRVVFGRAQAAGAATHIDLPGGGFFGLYLVQNASTARWLTRRGPARPRVFFSFPAANSDRFPHARRPAANVVAWEDLFRGGDRDFNDLVARWGFGPPRDAGPPMEVDVTSPLLIVDQPRPGQVTRAPFLSGRVTDDQSGVATLLAQLDGGPFVPVDIDPAGSFGLAVDLPRDGSADGPHTIRLAAYDRANNPPTLSDVPFILDTIAPEIAVDLAPESDSAPGGDSRTIRDRVRLVGRTEPGLEVTLAGAGRVARADGRGRFAFDDVPLPEGSSTFEARATDAAGNSGAARRTIDRVAPCGFEDGLVGWTILEDGGTDAGRGTVAARDGQATLREGDSFAVTLRRSFVVPERPTTLGFTYEALTFDTADAGSIKDAFEAALVDEAGNPLVPAIAPGRDAFFNVTEGQAPAVGATATIAGSTATADISALVPGTVATLVFRLVNNDGDRDTSVRLACVAFPAGAELVAAPPRIAGPGTATTRTVVADPGRVADFIPVPASPGDPGPPVPPSTVAIDAPADGSRVPAGTTVLIAGRVAPGGPGSVEAVTVDGVPVEALDDAGNFFTRVNVLPGRNLFTVAEVRAGGESGRVTLTVEGVPPASGRVDFASLADVSASFAAEYARTSFDEGAGVLYADVAVRNVGRYPADVPLLVGVARISDPSVRVLGAAGVTPDGVPYYDASRLVPGGTLAPGEGAGAFSLAFDDPGRARFTYDLVFLGRLDRAPMITTVPRVEAVAGRSYAYDVDALDPDGDPLRFDLPMGPPGMAIDAATGALAWSPADGDVGTHPVRVRVDDGRGGVAEQSFTIRAIVPPPNRPPVITSAPVVGGNVGVAYRYPAAAADPDGDAPTFRLLAGPVGMGADAATGEVTWTPTDDQLGDHAVTLEASDGRGGTATQAFSVCVAQAPGNHAPAIVSRPVTRLVAASSDLLLEDSFDSENGGSGVLNYSQFANWRLARGRVDLIGNGFFDFIPGNGLFLDLDGTPGDDAVLETRQEFELRPGPYRLRFDLAGSQRGDSNTVIVRLGDVYSETFTLANSAPLTRIERSIAVDRATTGTLSFHNPGSDTFGALLDNVRLGSDSSPYSYRVEAVDPDADDLAFSLAEAPEGMTIDLASGRIRWEGPAGASGPFRVTVRVEDGRGGVDEQPFAIEVGAQSGEIRGVKFEDRDGDGARDTVPVADAEPGLPGWTIYLDQDRNGRRDSGEPSTTTDAGGDYAFTGLAAGTYVVAEEGQPGWHQTAPSGATRTVSVATGQVVEGADFGNQRVDDATNRPPRFLGTAPGSAIAGELYRHDAAATDPDGDPLTFDLPACPDGMTVHPTLGVIVWAPTADQVGTHQVVLRARDGRGGIDLQSFVVAAASANTVPVISSTPPGPATARRPYRYQVRAQDAEGDTIAFGLDSPPRGVSIDQATGLLSWTPEDDQVGVSRIVVTADDGRGGRASQGFDLRVEAEATNRPPVVAAVAGATTWLGRTYVAVIEASDPDGDPLGYRIEVAPAGMTIDASGLVRWEPAASQLGPNRVVVLVDDGRGEPVPGEFTVAVVDREVNRPPAIVSTPRTTATVHRTYALDLVADDTDGDPVTWGLDVAPRGMSIDPLRGTLRWTPSADQLGPQEVVVRASDPTSASSTQRFVVDVACVNRPPSITSTPPTTAAVAAAYVYAVRAVDPEGDRLDFAFLAPPPDGMGLDPRTGFVRWTPAAGQAGTHRVAIRVDDGRGNVATQSFSIEVTATPPNRPPVITSTPRFAVALGSTYRYALVATDPDGETPTFALLAGPAGLALDQGTGVVTWTPAAAQVGTHVVTLAARDAAGGQGTQSFVLQASVNTAPAIASPPPARPAVAGAPFRYDARAVDPEGGLLAYAIDGPPGMTIDPLGRVAWTPEVGDVGTHPVRTTSKGPPRP